MALYSPHSFSFDDVVVCAVQSAGGRGGVAIGGSVQNNRHQCFKRLCVVFESSTNQREDLREEEEPMFFYLKSKLVDH